MTTGHGLCGHFGPVESSPVVRFNALESLVMKGSGVRVSPSALREVPANARNPRVIWDRSDTDVAPHASAGNDPEPQHDLLRTVARRVGGDDLIR